MADCANLSVRDVLQKFNSSVDGLNDAQVTASQSPPNILSATKSRHWWSLLWACIPNPFNILFAVLSIISIVAQQVATFVILIIRIALSIGLRFWQERKNSIALNVLIQRMEDKARVIRSENDSEVLKSELIPGDIVQLSGRDIIPADVVLINTPGLYVSQSTLTDENLPMLKQLTGDQIVSESILEASNIWFTGRTVVSGSAMTLVVATGDGGAPYAPSDGRHIHWVLVKKYFSDTRQKRI
jgi:magnesium-transporting ATPase (P-type)